MDGRANETANRLYGFLHAWTQQNPGWAYRQDQTNWIFELREVTEVAGYLMNSAEFKEVQLAAFLQSPDGQLVRTVVGWLLPGPEGAEFRLLVDAVLLAAKAKQRDQRVLAGVFSAAILLIIAGSFSS